MAMLPLIRIPKPPLNDFVDYFWSMSGYSPPHSKELTLPDGSADIVFELRQSAVRLYDHELREFMFGRAIVCGPHSNYFVIDTAGESDVVGIHFKPGGLRPFAGLPMAELLNRHIPLSELWGTAAEELLERLSDAGTAEERFDLLERLLPSFAGRPLERSSAIRYALTQLQEGRRVAELVERIGLSHGYLDRLFKNEIGLTPKRIGNLIRFQGTLGRMERGVDLDWAEVALACGYYDQSHWIKDFRRFSGLSPLQYRPIPGRHRNHASLSE